MAPSVVSGGQTGVDRAALDVALELQLPCGGWCPKGRLAEDGRIDPRYPLRETPTSAYAQRTEWNVRDSDGTLILTIGTPAGGTAATIQAAEQLGKPYVVLDLSQQPPAEAVHAWMQNFRLVVVNVAGPRESRCPGIYGQAAAFLRRVFARASDA